MPTRRPVNGPGPGAGDHRGELGERDPGLVAGGDDARHEQLGVLAGVVGDPHRARTHPSAVSSTTPAVTAGVAVSRASTSTARTSLPGGQARETTAVRTSSGRRSRRTSTCFSASRSATPSPHSTATTACGEVGVQVEVVQLGRAAEAVGVDVHERHPAVAPRPVLAGDDERRRRDGPGHAEAPGQAAHEHGLARAQRPGEDHQVARAEPVGEPLAERLGVGGGRQLDLGVQRRSLMPSLSGVDAGSRGHGRRSGGAGRRAPRSSRPPAPASAGARRRRSARAAPPAARPRSPRCG